MVRKNQVVYNNNILGHSYANSLNIRIIQHCVYLSGIFTQQAGKPFSKIELFLIKETKTTKQTRHRWDFFSTGKLLQVL